MHFYDYLSDKSNTSAPVGVLRPQISENLQMVESPTAAKYELPKSLICSGIIHGIIICDASNERYLGLA